MSLPDGLSKWRSGGLPSRSKILLAEDHIFSIRRRAYHESYRRFFFKDIQAFIVQDTPGRYFKVLGMVVLVIIALLFGLNSIPTMVVMLALTVPFLVYFILAGPTAKLYIKTAVQLESLPVLVTKKQI